MLNLPLGVVRPSQPLQVHPSASPLSVLAEGLSLNEKVSYQSRLGREDYDHSVPLRPSGRSLSYKRLQGTIVRRRTINKYLYVKVMPMLELERRDLYKTFRPKAVQNRCRSHT